LCLAGDALELLMAPGDVLAVRAAPGAPLSSRLLTEIGTTHGLMGHVLLVLSAPRCIRRESPDGENLQAAFPAERPEVQELWKVRTLESTRSEDGLHEAETLLYIEPDSGRLVIAGELEPGNTICLNEDAEQLELWQSPAELRARLRLDLMQKVLLDMKAHEASWSGATAIRAVLSSASLAAPAAGVDPAPTLETVKASWEKEPICTSVVVAFWQRYLCELAAAELGGGGASRAELSRRSLDLILQWMPIKADRGLPGDLTGAFRSTGWVPVAQVPRIFRPCFVQQPSFATAALSSAPAALSARSLSSRAPPEDASASADAWAAAAVAAANVGTMLDRERRPDRPGPATPSPQPSPRPVGCGACSAPPLGLEPEAVFG